MSAGEDLEPFSESIDEVFSRLGLPDPVLMSKIHQEWESLAGSPWVGRSRPLYVKSGTLVVEAFAPSMVALLRYGEASLTSTLKQRFGDHVISCVEVVAPGAG